MAPPNFSQPRTTQYSYVATHTAFDRVLRTADVEYGIPSRPPNEAREFAHAPCVNTARDRPTIPSTFAKDPKCSRSVGTAFDLAMGGFALLSPRDGRRCRRGGEPIVADRREKNFLFGIVACRATPDAVGNDQGASKKRRNAVTPLAETTPSRAKVQKRPRAQLKHSVA